MLYKAFHDYRTEGEGITAGKLYGVTAFKVSLQYTMYIYSAFSPNKTEGMVGGCGLGGVFITSKCCLVSHIKGTVYIQTEGLQGRNVLSE